MLKTLTHFFVKWRFSVNKVFILVFFICTSFKESTGKELDQFDNTYQSNVTQSLQNDSISLVRLCLKNQIQFTYDVLIGFSELGTEGVDFGFDSPYLPSSSILEFYTLIGSNPYTTQLLPTLTSTRVVSLGTVMADSGLHTFELVRFDNFDSSVRVYLEDSLTGYFHNLNSTPYTFLNDQSYTGVRFRLHFYAPVVLTSTGTCRGENNATIRVNNPNDSISVTLTNDHGVVSQSPTFIGEYVFENLTSGLYNIDIYLDSLDSVTQYVLIEEYEIIQSSFTSSAVTVPIEDAIIEFSANIEGSNQFSWDFGDSTSEVTETLTPVHVFEQPGIYTVTLTSTNVDCQSVVSLLITITDVSTSILDLPRGDFLVYPNSADGQLTIYNPSGLVYKFEMSTISGKVVLFTELDSVEYTIDTKNLASGVYSLTIIQGDVSKFVRIVIIH